MSPGGLLALGGLIWVWTNVSPCPEVIPSSRYEAKRTCISSIAGINPCCSDLAQLAPPPIPSPSWAWLRIRPPPFPHHKSCSAYHSLFQALPHLSPTPCVVLPAPKAVCGFTGTWDTTVASLLGAHSSRRAASASPRLV